MTLCKTFMTLCKTVTTLCKTFMTFCKTFMNLCKTFCKRVPVAWVSSVLFSLPFVVGDCWDLRLLEANGKLYHRVDD